MQDVIPMIAYEGGPAALHWLAAAFGFRETERILAPDGTHSHGEMTWGNGRIILSTPTPDYESPKSHRERCPKAEAWLSVSWIVDGVLVYVDDLDAHHEQAKRAGAVILSEPESGYPGRRYRAEDLEGHRWMFLEREHV